MERTILYRVYRGNIGILEEQMETMDYLEFRDCSSRSGIEAGAVGVREMVYRNLSNPYTKVSKGVTLF